MKRKIAAILAADIVAYSRLVAEDEEDTLSRLASYRRVFDDFVTRAGGRVFNTAGDSVLAEFPSAVEATRCAIDIQESMRTRNLGYAQSRQMLFRMGLTIGDVVEREGDLLGDGVNIAARLESLASPGGICVSQSIFEQVANKLSVPFRDLGQQAVKNIPQPVHAFMVDMHGDGAQAAGRSGRPSVLDGQPGRGQSSGARWAVVAGIIVVFAITGSFAGYYWHSSRTIPDSQQIAGSDPAPDSKISAAESTRPGLQTSDASKSARDDSAARQAATQQAALPVNPDVNGGAPKGNNSAPPVTKPPQRQSKPQIPDGASPGQIFALLSKAGGIVQDARTPPELYHNARVWESRGQAAEARQAYGKLAVLGTEAIDAHMRYAAIIRAQDGRAGAREVYSVLADSKGGRVAELVHGLQFSGAERRSKVAAFAARHPAYAPVQMLLAREFSTDRLGSQTLSDKRQQFAALRNFLKAEEDGTLPKFFMDQSVLSQWVDEARKTYALLEKYFKTAILKPVASYMRSNQSWIVSVSLPEAATGISYRIGESRQFKSTGTFPHIDQRTGQPMPNPSFELPASAKAAKLHIRYRDSNNIEQGPFTLDFEPRSALIRSQRDILERFSSSWVMFGGEQVQQSLLYFSHLLSYRCAIKKAVIGFGDGALDKELPIAVCDMSNPHAIGNTMRPYLRVPRTLQSVRVQLTYADGTRSEVKTFTRRR